jgi:hypothetical protein
MLVFLNGTFDVGGCAGASGLQTPCCPWYQERSGSGPNTPYTALDFTLQNICVPADVSLTITRNFYSGCANRLKLSTQYGTFYDSGCFTGTGTASATLPAGATYLHYVVEGACAGSCLGDLWDILIECA